ncbi:MAG: DUF3563 family protein [Oxalobacteraceae bacterium]|nr:DUF3563 family protein [Oxalobacteraceae bacterium]
MSVITRQTSSSPLFNALQHLCAHLVPVVHYRASDAVGATSDATASAVAERKPMGFFKRLGQSLECREMKEQEAYLAESADIYELEYRMKQLDHVRSFNGSQWCSNSRYY